MEFNILHGRLVQQPHASESEDLLPLWKAFLQFVQDITGNVVDQELGAIFIHRDLIVSLEDPLCLRLN